MESLVIFSVFGYTFRMSSVSSSLRHKLLAVRNGHKVSKAVSLQHGSAEHR